jgi:hypothetical protein
MIAVLTFRIKWAPHTPTPTFETVSLANAILAHGGERLLLDGRPGDAVQKYRAASHAKRRAMTRTNRADAVARVQSEGIASMRSRSVVWRAESVLFAAGRPIRERPEPLRGSFHRGTPRSRIIMRAATQPCTHSRSTATQPSASISRRSGAALSLVTCPNSTSRVVTRRP